MKMRKNLLAAGVALALGGAMATSQAAILTDSDATFGSFDSSSGSRGYTIVGGGTVADVNINIHFAKCDDPSLGSTEPAIGTACIGGGFSYDREIHFVLSNGFRSVNLIVPDTWGGSTPGAGVVSMTFDDEGAALPGGPTTGSFQAVGSLSDFDGDVAAGAWSLFIRDDTGADRLDYWQSTLTITTAAVPEPMTLGLLGLGLLGLGFSRRKA